jgi:hypothetical protein
MKQSDPGFIAYLPSKVRYDNSLPFGARIIYAEISALCNSKGYCWANNKYFADLYNNSKDTISRWISDLEKAGYIKCFVAQDEGNSRKIYLVNASLDYLSEEMQSRQKQSELSVKSPKGSRQKNRESIGKNAEHNSIVNNTLNNTVNNNSANAHFLSLQNEGQENLVTQKAEPATIKGRKKNEDVHRADALQKNAIQLKEEFIAELERKGIAHYYEPFKAAWLEWIRYKKEIKNTYKSAQSAATGFKSMLEKSKYNPETALRIVETAVANCWKGLQEERRQFNPSGKSKVQEQHEDLVSYVMQKRNLLNG